MRPQDDWQYAVSGTSAKLSNAVTAVLRSAAAGLRSSQLRVRLLRPPVRKRSVLSTPSHAENFTFRHTDRRAA